MHTIDVVIPCYNYGRFLEACVASVLRQEGVDVRILIIDDESSDDTASVGERLAAGHAAVEYRRHARNRGNIATYNEGIEWATAEFFLLLSADDLLLPGALKRATDALAADPAAVLCHGRVQVIHDGDAIQPVAASPSRYATLTGRQFRERTADDCVASPIYTPTAVVRTAAQKRVGGYDPALPHTGDTELWLRFSLVGSIVELEAQQAAYRRHGHNMHYGFPGLVNIRHAQRACASAFERIEDEAERTQLLQRSRRSLALGAVRVANHASNEGDDATCAQAMAVAQELWPSVRGTAAWRLMLLRRLIPTRSLNWCRRVAGPLLHGRVSRSA